MTENGLSVNKGTFTREGLFVDPPELLNQDLGMRRIVKDLLWEYAYDVIGDTIRRELELFFMRKDPTFQRILKEINEAK